MNEVSRATGPRQERAGPSRKTGMTRRRQATAASVVLLSIAGKPAAAQETFCPAPATERESTGSTGGTSAQERLRHSDPMVRDMARADILYDEGRIEAAEAVYKRLAAAPADKRQTSRRAKLKLAQVALRRGDFAAAEARVAEATGPGALPDLQARGRRLLQQIADRRSITQAEVALDAVDPLVKAGRLDEAIEATRRLLQQPCPRPADYAARVKIRLAQLQRVKGDLAGARATAQDALASASTPRVRERAGVAIGDIEAAIKLAELRAKIDRANALIEANQPAAAVAELEPLLSAQPPLPPELQTNVRLRLARAYGRQGNHDAAVAVVAPLLAAAPSPTPGVPGGVPALEPEQYEAISRVYLARASHLQASRQDAAAALAYQELVNWQPPAPPEVQGAARLGLARVLARQGKKTAAREQLAFLRESNPETGLLQRADELLADIEGEPPLDRLVGYVQAGLAYDTNAPTLVSAIRDDDEDVPFPADQRFDDVHVNIASRLQYRTALGQGGDYLDFHAHGTRTFQFELPELDRTRVGVQAGPVFAIDDAGRTRARAGAQFDINYRGDRFRSSEPALYIGLEHEISDTLSLDTAYALTWHNDYQDERDGINHELESRLRFDPTPQDVLTVNARVEREEGKLDRVENWRLLGGAAVRHRWQNEGMIEPFVEVGGEAERVIFDGREIDGGKRRDWKVNLEAAVGADIASNWRVRLHYSYFDVSSNQEARDRLANHQTGLSLRYTWR